MIADDDENNKLLLLCLIFAAAVWYNSLRTRSRLIRSAILEARLSPWIRLLQYGDEGSFLELMGFTRDAFNNLRVVTFDENDNRIGRVGRPSSLDYNGELGLYLFYVGSQIKIKYLCLIFGVVPTTATDS